MRMDFSKLKNIWMKSFPHCPAPCGIKSPVSEFGWNSAAGAFSMVDTKKELSLTYFQEVHGWNVNFQKELVNALYSCFE